MNSTRLLIALLTVLSILPLTVSVLEKTAALEYDHLEISDEIAFERLRRIYLLSYERQIETDRISFIYQEREFELQLVNSKLILSPGTQIFLDEVDSLEFRTEGDLVWIAYERRKTKYEKVLGKSEGLHLDDFSIGDECDHDTDDESLLSDEDVPADS